MIKTLCFCYSIWCVAMFCLRFNLFRKKNQINISAYIYLLDSIDRSLAAQFDVLH